MPHTLLILTHFVEEKGNIANDTYAVVVTLLTLVWSVNPKEEAICLEKKKFLSIPVVVTLVLEIAEPTLELYYHLAYVS